MEEIGILVDVLANHIDCLAEAFLISKDCCYDIKERTYIGANLKYYFTDLGLRNARLNFRQQEPAHIMEKWALTHMQCIQYALDHPAVVTVLPGVRNIDDLRNVLDYVNTSPEEKDYSVIGEFTPQDVCVQCGHCKSRRPFHVKQEVRMEEIA